MKKVILIFLIIAALVSVAFVYLCLNSEKEGWEKTSKVMGIGEQNYFLNAKQSSDTVNTSCENSKPQKFFILVPTAEKEAEMVFYFINNIIFYEENGYEPALLLPNVPLINSLKAKVKEGNRLSKDDFIQLKNIFENEIFDENDYILPMNTMINAAKTADKQMSVFEYYEQQWGFFIPDKYNIMLTLYGPGGSYNPSNGNISMKISKHGIFSIDPLGTILHEAFHIGIEKIIIQEYNIPHGTKERIVDQFIHHKFKNIVPTYQMQPMGDVSIDVIFEDDEVFDDLPIRIKSFMMEKSNINNNKGQNTSDTTGGFTQAGA